MGSCQYHFVLAILLFRLTTSLAPQRSHNGTPSKTSLPVAFSPPISTAPQTTHYGVRSFVQKQDDKGAHEYRWLTWLYQHWKAVPVGVLEPEILKQFVPALAAYGRRQTSQSATQAEELLDRFVQEYRAGNKEIPLENTAFHAVMDAYSKCAQPEKAKKVLQKMIDLAKSEKDLAPIVPDVFSFTILATAWARSRHPGAADKAERLLNHMENKGMNVTTLTYNVVLNAIAVSHDPGKAARAATIVRKMQKLATAGHFQCKPDLYTYQSWIHACSRTRGGVPQTMEIFKYLDAQAAAGNKELRPNAYCFAAAIHAWAYSLEANKAKKAYELLQDMRQRHEIFGQKYCKPNVVVFTSVINACVKPVTYEDRNSAFHIAQLVFEELLHSPYGTPNFLTYAAFLHVCGTALDDASQRDSCIRRIFGMCQQYGCVGRIVIQKLEEYASEELLEELIAPYESWDEIPASWKRRVKGERFMKPHTHLTIVEPSADEAPSAFSTSKSKSLRFVRNRDDALQGRSFSKTPSITWQIQLL